MTGSDNDLQRLAREVAAGRLSRREFMRRTLALGLSASAVAAFLAACGEASNTGGTGGGGASGGGAATTTTTATAQTTTTAAATTTTAAATAGTTRPADAGAAPAPLTGATRTGVTDREIVIGSWGPQDGPAGAYGIINRTHAAFFKAINDQGGIEGRRIRFIYENDSYQPARTVGAVRKLLDEDRIFCLVGGLGTPNNAAVMDTIVQNGVPHIAPSTGSTILIQPPKRQVFALQVNYPTEATLLTRHALDNLRARRFAVFYQNDAFGKEGFDSVNAELKRRGQPEATGVTYEPSDTNFASQALRLQTSGADTVVLWAVPRPGGGIIQEMTKIGFKPANLLASAVINDPAIFQLAGPGIEGLYTGAWLPDFKNTANPKVAEFHEFMKKNLPTEQIGGFAETGYAHGQLVTELLRRVGRDLTRERLIQTAESVQNWTGSIIPNVSYSPTDHQGVKGIYVMQAKGGEFVEVAPFQELR